MTRLLYRCLLRLHPSRFRDKYAEEMLWIFDESRGNRDTSGLLLDAAASLLRQWTLRHDTPEPPRRARVDGIPSFGAYNRTPPAKNVLACGAVCSLLTFAVMGAVISRGGGVASLPIPQASGATGLPISFLALAPMPQATAPDEPGSISGRIFDGMTGQPLASIGVIVYGQGPTISATTDSSGEYKLEGLRPGRQTVAIRSSREHSYSGSRAVTVKAGERAGPLDFRLFPNPSISGRITDENDEPIEGAEVSLLSRSYFAGEVRYHRKALTRSDDQGAYRVEYGNWSAGPELLLWVRLHANQMQPFSNEPAEMALRRPAFVSTYFPNATRPEEASIIRLTPGEQREDVDVRMIRAPGHCIEAQVSLPHSDEGAGFFVQTQRPSFGLDLVGGIAGFPSGGKLGVDGQLRLCGLARDDYRITVYSGNINSPDAMGIALVSVTDEDVQDLQITASPRLPLQGRTIWVNSPPEQPLEARIAVRLYSLNRAMGSSGAMGRSGIPGEFTVESELMGRGKVAPLMEEYIATIAQLPAGVYVKDVLYGNRSVLYQPFALGSERAGAELRVFLDHDGGRLQAVVADRDGNPASEATVVVIPKTAGTHLQLAQTRLAGTTDQNGEYATPAVAPGEYLVLAVEGDFTDLSPETIAALFDARSKAQEVNIGPNATVEVELEARRLPR